MNRGLLVLNVVLLAAVAVLFYLYFSNPQPKEKKAPEKSAVVAPAKEFRIAYFEMDSIEKSFTLVKDVKNELGREEDRINGEMANLEKKYRDKIAHYQAQAATMNQVQSEMANRDVLQLQENIRGRKQELDQKYQDLYMRKMREVKTKIETFLKDYNGEKGFSYIFAYEPGLFYYRDTAYNITQDVIRGLNSQYTTKKK
ncbi:MAG TPA: OmpH family outer membrane protein [Chitinophagaceae bacterium]|jgi:outer membrane protein|nr:OmpH family outer membrane protein [Chitinophagaceae bacterium]